MEKLVSNRYFDVYQDFAVIEDGGGFFCQGCLMDKDKTEISPDPRYCRDCYDFLIKEAKMLTVHSRVDWKPRGAQDRRNEESKFTN